VTFLVAVVIGVAFGGADQYLGSLAAVPWASSVSLLSAPWLVLPFVFGCTQRIPRRAVAIGLLVTFSALLGYGIMTLSPIEGVHVGQNPHAIVALFRSEAKLLVGGMVTGPLYGLLGQRWRVRRAWMSAALVAGAVCFEPLVDRVVGQFPTPSLVPISEFALGMVMAAGFVLVGVISRRRSEGTPRQPA
jgi:hypothetical protein